MTHSDTPENPITPENPDIPWEYDSVAIMLDYGRESYLVGDFEKPFYDTVSAWWVTVLLRRFTTDGDVFDTQIGRLDGALVDLTTGMNPYVEMDFRHADWEAIGAVLFGQRPEILASLSHVILIDHVWIDPAYRGDRLGARSVATVIETLSKGRACLTALIPQPDGWRNMTPEDHTQAVGKIQKLWASIGFTPATPNVFLLDATGYKATTYFPLRFEYVPPQARHT